ncbi:MAG: toll/interleukin-1 receptor domain-containing protein [Spirochaetaceae bacterium]|nr:toll/interleukin-1 receptor domain-containing protein [Spirochaetaceae bacterium]
MKVFISHAHSDEHLAQKVAAILQEAGLEVWDAMREILPGDNWAQEVSNALQESEAMVILLTPDAVRSEWVRREMRWNIEYALGEVRFRSRLIPVVAGDPDILNTEGVPWILRHQKMVDLTQHENEEEGIREVARTLLQVA